VARKPPDPARRNEHARASILAAAFDLCRDRGYEKTTIEAIAQRAGVGKQTIYRWWPSKGAVILEALNEAIGVATDFADSGDVTADLREQMTAVSRLFTSTDFGSVYSSAIGAAQDDADMAEGIVQDIIGPRFAAARKRLARAQEQNQIRAGADLDVIVELLYGALYYRYLIKTRPPDAEQVRIILDLAFAGLRPAEYADGRPYGSEVTAPKPTA
jgi:AcrR family transcriptional regulator